MTRTLRDEERDSRLREWMDLERGVRGRFTLLERESGISAQSWKNMYYKRQSATSEMLDFVHKVDTISHQWVVTGIRSPSPDSYPFDRLPTAHERSTLSGRLVWAVKDFAGPRGAALFTYLESRWRKAISADEWAAVVLGETEATTQMVESVCADMPHLALWITTGRGDHLQVDPLDEVSVQRWVKSLQARVAVANDEGEQR